MGTHMLTRPVLPSQVASANPPNLVWHEVVVFFWGAD